MTGTIVSRLARRAARRYIAGPELQDARSVCGMLAERGFGSTIGYWNGDEPHEGVLRQYLLALEANDLRPMDCSVSIKAPALGYDEALLRDVTAAAQRRGTPVHFDSLGPETADLTLHAIERLVRDCETIGCTLPGRWRRSVTDSDAAVRLGLRVRVVKGQWAGDTGTDYDPVSGFIAVVERLAGRAIHVGVATHDARLARRTLVCLLHAATPCELELLWGLPCDGPLRVARELGVAVRFYVPYGHAWLPYALSRALTHPQVFLWFLRDMLARRDGSAWRINGRRLHRDALIRRGGTQVPFL